METLVGFKKFNENRNNDFKDFDKYIIYKSNEIYRSYEILDDVFEFIIEHFDSEGLISEETKYELEDYVSDNLPSINEDEQEDINNFLKDIISEFNINLIENLLIIINE